MFIPMRRILSGLAAALGVGLFAQSAWAQTQPPSLEEVVVTARRRDETFQNVPITVNVFTAQQIQSAGIESPRDFVAMVPNMTMVEVQNVGNSFITVRGISQARNSEPSVAVLVDGVLETNPYQFNQELTDIQQIEVLKGPQGAIYGRNAIGGAIIIHTVDPSDHFEGTTKVGIGNGVSEKAQAVVSGPIDSAGTLRYRASVNFYNTDGYLHNTYLDRKADPSRDYSGRLRLLWKPADEWSADLRVFRDRVETTAYYYVIPRDDEANPFSTFTTPPNANNVTSPIQTNNLGEDNRDVLDTALKLDYNAPFGTFTSVSDYNRTKEIDTGDAYDFRPVQNSIAYNAFFATIPPALGGPLDESQSQFIDVKTWSQEFRFAANKVGGFSWQAGVYYVHTERFISTDNIVDRGTGVPRVYQNPLVDPTNPFADNTNVTFLSDSQNNNAWAVFGDATYELTSQLELDAAIRYDEDSRQNTTDTPTRFLPDPTAVSGEVRKHTFSETQPKGTLRYKPTDNLTVYGGWSRGFRSGGFNQTGVGAIAQAAGRPRCPRPVQRRSGRYLGGGCQEPVPRPAAECESVALPHQVAQWLLLLLRFDHLDSESRQSRRHLQGSRARAGGETHRPARLVRELRVHGWQDRPDGGPHGRGQQAAAADEGHHRRGIPVPAAARRRDRWHAAPRLSANRPYVVGPVQCNLTRSGQSDRPARRLRERPLDGDCVVEEPDQQNLQCRVFHGWLPLESLAAPLRGRFYL